MNNDANDELECLHQSVRSWSCPTRITGITAASDESDGPQANIRASTCSSGQSRENSGSIDACVGHGGSCSWQRVPFSQLSGITSISGHRYGVTHVDGMRRTGLIHWSQLHYSSSRFPYSTRTFCPRMDITVLLLLHLAPILEFVQIIPPLLH